jgi:hypothetical protein
MAAALPTTPGLLKLADLLTRKTYEQAPDSLPVALWEVLFTGLGGDHELSEEAWAFKLRAAYEAAAVAYFTTRGLLDEYHAVREVELGYLRRKFNNSPCCSCPLAEVRDVKALFERVCLLWYSLEAHAGEDSVIAALSNSMRARPKAPRAGPDAPPAKRARVDTVALSVKDAEFAAKGINEEHAEAALEPLTTAEATAHWARVCAVTRILTQGTSRCKCAQCPLVE